MNTKSLRICFHGKMGSGKDTASDYLIRKYGGVKLTFAEPLYDLLYHCQKKCGFTIEKDRKFLQFIGTEWARTKDENIWIKLAIEKLKKLNCNVFNNDCRFENELTALKNENFFCIKIVRDGNFEDRLIGGGKINHESIFLTI